MDSLRILLDGHLTGRHLCRAIAQFSMIVFAVSALVSWNVISRGGCTQHADPIGTIASVTAGVAGIGIVLLVFACLSMRFIFFLDSAFSKAPSLSGRIVSLREHSSDKDSERLASIKRGIKDIEAGRVVKLDLLEAEDS
jgi:hypothetical protein